MNLVRLRQTLVEYFSESELHDLCFDLGIDHENLPGKSKRDLAREMVTYLDRRSRTAELLDIVSRLRPHVFSTDSHKAPGLPDLAPTKFPPAGSDKPATFSNGYALLIGVGADLPITIQDATALRNLLIDPNRAAYPPEQVELLAEAAANRQGILNAFDRLIDRVNNNPDATAIIYFSGHAGRIQGPGTPTEYFLVPHGYNPSQRKNTAISGLEFTDKIEAIKARKLIVFLDCCHAGGVPALKEPGLTFVKSPIPPELLTLLDSGSGHVVIASSHEDEFSYTGTPNSVFTACLLEAMAGKASVSQGGFVRILDTLIYLFQHVPERAPGPQHPLVKKVLDLGDNFPLCYYGGIGKYPSVQMPTIQFATETEKVTPRHRKQFKQKLEGLQQEWDLRSEKVKRLRAALAIEAGVVVRFQLEQQILEEEAQLAHLDSEMDQIEQALQ